MIVVLSYRQTIYAYPSGGGRTSSPRRTSAVPSLVAGASLLADYILTVAVSVAGGVLAIQSAFEFDAQWRVLVPADDRLHDVANLRGLKSRARCSPLRRTSTSSCWLLIGVGYTAFFGDLGPIPLGEASEEPRRRRGDGKR